MAAKKKKSRGKRLTDIIDKASKGGDPLTGLDQFGRPIKKKKKKKK